MRRWTLPVTVVMGLTLSTTVATVEAPVAATASDAPVTLTAAPVLAAPAAARRAPEPEPVDCRVARCVALTFDDGPSPHTPALLDTLDRTGAKATFFMVGWRVRAMPQTVRRAFRAGHEIGSHTWDHPDLRRLSYAQVEGQIVGAQAEIGRITGQRPRVFRPPYGATSQHVVRVTRARGLPQVMWSVDPRDWENRNSAHVANHIVRHVRPNDVVLMHDTRPTTVRAVPAIIRRLRQRGFTFVTVSTLFPRARGGEFYPPGARTWWRP